MITSSSTKTLNIDKYVVVEDGFSLRSYPDYRLAKDWADRHCTEEFHIELNGVKIVKLKLEELGDALW